MTIQALADDAYHQLVAGEVQAILNERLAAARPGHCLRVSNLSTQVMHELCADMNVDGTLAADIALLLGPRQHPQQLWEVTATRLIELRNAGLRPLLVFVPPGIKTAAEDSFDVSTFSEVDLLDVADRLRRALYSQLPEELQQLTQRALHYLQETEAIIDDDDVVRYYLTVLHNGATRAAAGGAIYQLRLIPDFSLFDASDRLKHNLSRNVAARRSLLESPKPLLGRILELKLKPNTIQTKLYAFLRQQSVEDILVWGGRLANEPALRDLTFDYWPDDDIETPPTRMLIFVDDLGLPARDPAQPVGADNPQYLDVQRATTLKVQWHTDPKPVAMDELDHFRIELVSTADAETGSGGGAIAWESGKIAGGPSPRATRSKSLRVADFRDQVEDGLYFVRVRAYTRSGEILNDEDPQASIRVLRDPHNPFGKRQNESDDVWFWKDASAPPPAEPTRNQFVESFLEAQTLARFAAIDRGGDPFAASLIPQADKTRWASDKRSKRGESTYHIVYDAQTRFTFTVSSLLRRIESDILRQPDNLGRWRLTLADDRNQATELLTERLTRAPERIPGEFLAARRALFTAIAGGTADNLVATVDILQYEALVLRYAAAYGFWLQHAIDAFDGQVAVTEGNRKRLDPLMIDIDVVEVRIPNRDLAAQRAYLLAPTHPLRMLWHLQHARMVSAWLQATLATEQPSKALNPVLRQIMRRVLLPFNLPPVLRATHENSPVALAHFYVEANPLTRFWGVYLREDLRDSGSVLDRLRRALGMGSTPVSADSLDSDLLASSFARYLVQHPYVRTLKVNVFNPGDARSIVAAVLAVESILIRRHLPLLRYELRLFTHGDRVDEAGRAIDELLNPERQVSAEADAFTVASNNPLYPKLHFSRNTLRDFLDTPAKYEAHISILHDLFPVKVEPASEQEGRSSFIYGLVQLPVTHFSGGESDQAWRRQVMPHACRELPDDKLAVSAQISQIAALIGQLQASVAVGQRVDTVPTVQLRLSAEDKSLLYQVHEVSGWVLTADRNLGPDYYDSDLPDDRPIYILDYRPEYIDPEGAALMLTTRSIEEIQQLVYPKLQEYGLLLGDGTEIYFLRLLRSLSGRLALKLLSSPTHVSEAIGIAFARLLLEQYNLLDNRIVIPLDAHNYLFAEALNEVKRLENDVTLQRADLLLVGCDPGRRLLHFQVVEVKFRTHLGSFSDYIGLKQTVERQISSTITYLRKHFDPDLERIDRIERPLKTMQLVGLLEFYLVRAGRYNLVAADAAKALRTFIDDLDAGYVLRCSGVGLVFDLGANDIDIDDEDLGLVFYRVGRDYMERMLNNGLRRRALLQEQTREAVASTIEERQSLLEERQRIVRDTTLQRDPKYARVRTSFEPDDISENGPGVEPSSKQPLASASNADESLVPLNGHETPKSSQGLVSGPQDVISPRSDAVQPHEPSSGLTQPPAMSVHSSLADMVQPDAQRAAINPQSIEWSIQGNHLLPEYDALLGDTGPAKQYGLLGTASGRRVALDLNGTNTISLFGVQGGGKSYTVGAIVEMAVQQIPGINLLPAPLAAVVFHYHESQDYAPEFVSMVAPNNNETQLRALAQEYGAMPTHLNDVLILTSADKIANRRVEFPGVNIAPIAFSSSELSIKDWRFLMGVMGNQMYMKQINLIMRQLREKLTLDTLREEIDASDLSDGQKTIARIRLDFAAQFIVDTLRLSEQLRPGRLIIVDLRDEFIDKDEALGLFVVMLNIFANAGRDQGFNKLIVFDEAHKYMDNPDLTEHIVDVIRQMRHQGVSVLIASQDPPSLPNAIIELSSLLVLHRFNSPQWLKHIQKSITALSELSPTQMAGLRPGEAYIWATKATERVFTQKAVRIQLRPRITRHGGGTKTAV